MISNIAHDADTFDANVKLQLTFLLIQFLSRPSTHAVIHVGNKQRCMQCILSPARNWTLHAMQQNTNSQLAQIILQYNYCDHFLKQHKKDRHNGFFSGTI